MKPWLNFCFMIAAFWGTALAQNSNTTFEVLGKNLLTKRGIFGYIIAVENKRFDQVLVDTARMLLKVRLTGVNKEGLPTEWRARSLAVYDLSTLQMKWSKNFPGTQTILMTDHYMTYSLQSAHSLEITTGKQLWKISPSLWYIDDKSGIGLSVDQKVRIQGVNLTNGKILWERKMEKTFTGRGITHLNDSTLLFNDNGLQTLTLSTGRGWIYDASSMSKYATAVDIAETTLDVMGALVGISPSGGNNHIVRPVNSNVLRVNDRIYFAARDRISCLTQNGKLVWERFFAKDTMSLMSASSLISKHGRLYLLNEGHAEINFLDEPFGKPFLASFAEADGSMYFLKKFDYVEPVKGFRQTDSTLAVITENSIAEYRLADGSRSRIKLLNKEQPALKAFAPEEFLFRDTEDTTHFGQIISGDNKHYVLTEKLDLVVFDNALTELGKLSREEYYINWLKYRGYRFIGNAKKTIVLDRQDKAVAILNLSVNSWGHGDRIYSTDGGKLTVIKLKEIIPPK